MKNKLLRNISFVILLATVISLASVLCGCGNAQDMKVVGTVGDYEVHYEELRYLTLQYKDLLASNYGADIWDKSETAETYREELEASVYGSIISNYAVLSLCDDPILTNNGEKFIDIDGNEIRDIVDDEINATIEELGGKSEYEDALKKNYLTDNLYRFITGVDVCEGYLLKYYCSLLIIDDSDETASDYIYNNFIRTMHVYIQNDAKDDIEKNRQTAEAVRVKLLGGESISDLITKYSEDKYMSTADGYYFTHGMYSKAYEDASFALEIGQVSDVIETYSGFYVIKRMPLDDKYIAANYLSLKNQYLLAKYDEILEERKSYLTFTPNDYGNSLDLTKIK